MTGRVRTLIVVVGLSDGWTRRADSGRQADQSDDWMRQDTLSSSRTE